MDKIPTIAIPPRRNRPKTDYDDTAFWFSPNIEDWTRLRKKKHNNERNEESND